MQNFRLQQSNTSNQAMFSTTIRRIMKSQKKKKREEEKKTTRLRGEKTNTEIFVVKKKYS